MSVTQRLFYAAHAPVRRAMLRTVRSAKRARRMAAERAGIDRYSRPALFDMDRKLAEFLPAIGMFVEAGAHDGYQEVVP